jgi:translation initiation factor IF-3
VCSDGNCCPFFIFSGRCHTISTLEHQINEEIRDKEVRLIDSDGSQLGIVTIQAAMEKAAERNLDLVKIAPKAEPPVCRVMDYGKFRFEQAKKEKEARKNQKVVDIKEVRLSAKIDVHDFEVRVKSAQKFLTSGDKVKASIRFRGREMAHTDIGLGVMQRFAEACAEFGVVEKPAKLEGRQMLMFLAPAKNK